MIDKHVLVNENPVPYFKLISIKALIVYLNVAIHDTVEFYVQTKMSVITFM